MLVFPFSIGFFVDVVVAIWLHKTKTKGGRAHGREHKDYYYYFVG